MKDILRKLTIAGTGLSIVCSLHCLLVPLILLAAPMLSSWGVFSEEAETTLIAGSVIVAAAVLALGFRQHRQVSPVGVMLVAVMLLILGRTVPEEGAAMEVVFVASGAVVLAASQFLNLRHLRHCDDCATESGKAVEAVG